MTLKTRLLEFSMTTPWSIPTNLKYSLILEAIENEITRRISDDLNRIVFNASVSDLEQCATEYAIALDEANSKDKVELINTKTTDDDGKSTTQRSNALVKKIKKKASKKVRKK